MADYSGKPLAEKLGIKGGQRVGVIGDPGHFRELVAPLPDGVELANNPRAPCEIFVLFARDRPTFTSLFPKALANLPADGSLWISWPKKSSPKFVDMTEDTVREVALPTGVVDNRVCAVDDDWSALRLVVRRENRHAWAATAG